MQVPIANHAARRDGTGTRISRTLDKLFWGLDAGECSLWPVYRFHLLSEGVVVTERKVDVMEKTRHIESVAEGC
jgi:hypothetical protein